MVPQQAHGRPTHLGGKSRMRCPGSNLSQGKASGNPGPIQLGVIVGLGYGNVREDGVAVILDGALGP